MQRSVLPSTWNDETVAFRLRQMFFFFFFILISFPPMGFAADDELSFGTLLCNAHDNSYGYAAFLAPACWVIGLFLVVKGVLLAKKHVENPNDSQVVKLVAHIVGGACMMCLPQLAGVVQSSLFGAGGGGGEFACTPGGTVTASTLDGMMQSFVKNIYGPIFSLLSMIGVAVGLTFIVRGLMRGAKIGTGAQTADPKSVIVHLIFGAILISGGSMLTDMIHSVFGTDTGISSMTSYDALSWSKLAGDGADTKKIEESTRAILAFIQIIGGIAFLRGWLIVKSAVEGGGQATIPQGLTHIIGGVMAINIDIMIQVFNATFGLDIIG